MIRTIRRFSAATTAAATTTLMLALAAAAAPAAQATWHWSPATVAIPGTFGRPAVAMSDTKAITVAAPDLGGGVLVSTREPYGSWSAPLHLGGDHRAFGVHVAANAHGDVVVGWADDVQHVAIRPAGQSFLPTVDLPRGEAPSDGEDYTPQVGINDAQEVVTAWIAAGDHGNELRYTAGSLGAPVQAIHSSLDVPGSGNMTENVSLRTIHQGPSALSWIGFDGSLSTVHAVLRRQGAEFGAPQQVTTAGEIPEQPAVTVNELAQAAVVYTTWDGTNRRVELTRTGLHDAFEPATMVSPAGVYAQAPDVGWVIGSNIHLAWTTDDGGTGHTAVSALAPQSGALGVLDTHAYDATNGSPVRVFVSRMQRTTTVYSLPYGGSRSIGWLMGDIEARRVWSVIDGPASTWGTPALTGDDLADNVTAWADAGTTYVSIWDATAPDVRSVSIPDTVTAGQRFTVSISGADPLSAITGYSWTVGNAAGNPTGELPPTGEGTATGSFSAPGTYSMYGKIHDAGENVGGYFKKVTVLPAPVGRPVRHPAAAKRCEVPSLTNHTKAGAQTMLRRAHCALGKVTTPKRYKNRKGLVIRGQSRPAGQHPVSGAHVAVTLGVKPKPKAKHKKKAHKA